MARKCEVIILIEFRGIFTHSFDFLSYFSTDIFSCDSDLTTNNFVVDILFNVVDILSNVVDILKKLWIYCVFNG